MCTMPFVQHGGEFARVAGSVTARSDAQKMAADSVELAAGAGTIPGHDDAALGKEIGPTVPLSQVKRRNQAQTPSGLLPKPSDQPAAIGKYPLGIIPHGV